jgi:putative ABC transport system substrate-binding protein
VTLGLVSSLNRPGGNITGVYVMTNSLEAKRLGLLNELISNASSIGVLVNPDTPGAESQRLELQSAATALKRNVAIIPARDERDIDTAMANFARLHTNALLVAADPFFFAHRELLVALAARFAIPTMYEFREYVVGGGLISYGISLVDAYRQIGRYTGRILKGAKAADLPVMQPTTFELVINLKTARALGVAVPPTLLARADEVIE